MIHFGEIPVGAQRGMGHVGQSSGQAGGHPGQQWPGAWTEMGSGGGETGLGSGSILKGVSTGLPGWDVDVRKGIRTTAWYWARTPEESFSGEQVLGNLSFMSSRYLRYPIDIQVEVSGK